MGRVTLVPAVMLSHGPGPEGPARARIDLGQIEALHGAARVPGAYVVATGDLERLRGAAGVAWHGRKADSVPLSRRLLHHETPAAMPLSPASTGKLLGSVRTLLRNAWSKRQGGAHACTLYFFGVPARQFDKLWAEAATTAAPGTDGGGSAVARALVDAIARSDDQDDLVARRFVGDTDDIRLVRFLARRAAAVADPVLILGETGTGKEAVARAIHDLSPRRDRPFVIVNCAAIPADLFESELFGHARGAFTGAVGDRVGLWEQADGGTLLLDELGDLAADHQGKILRVLEDGAVRPVGAPQSRKVDVRIIAATNRDIGAQVRAGQFRDDLYYRLRAIPIRTPPLRDHPRDIPALAQWFWRNKICNQPDATLAADVLAELQLHTWPGNAREVKAVLMNMRALFGTELGAKHVRLALHLEGHTLEAAPPRADGGGLELALHRFRHLRLVDDALRAAQRTLARSDVPPAFLRRHLEELALLAQRGELFVRSGSHALVDAARARLAAPPDEDSPGWRADTAAACQAALAALDDDARLLIDPAATPRRRGSRGARG
jgi:DNA-binding NtrC family response regulator